MKRFFFLNMITKPKLQIFFDPIGNESCKGGPKQNFGKSWNYWVNLVDLSIKTKSTTFQWEISPWAKTFLANCRSQKDHAKDEINIYVYLCTLYMHSQNPSIMKYCMGYHSESSDHCGTWHLTQNSDDDFCG